MLISRYFTESSKEKREELLINIEKKYDFKYSDEYKKFLIEYNGGETVDTYYKTNKLKTDITHFVGVSDDVIENVSYYIKLDVGIQLLSKNMVIIATNSFGDYFAIDVSKEANGRIYFVYHDQNKLILIENSFNELIKNCKSEKVGHIRSIEERKQDMIKAGKENKITDIKMACWQKEIDKYKNIKQEEVII